MAYNLIESKDQPSQKWLTDRRSSLGRERKARSDNARVGLFCEESMTINDDVAIPLWDGITETCKRWGGIHRNTFNNKFRPRVETRMLGAKIVVKQVGPRSMQELIQSAPPGFKPQSANLQRGTEESHARSVRRKRRLHPARERGRQA
jgi:hypothetical protein